MTDKVPVGTQSGHTTGGALDNPITWRSITRIFLGFAGEYALLSLIEDAPEALKVTTVICAVAGLFALETEDWLKKRHAYLFGSTIAILALVYLSFVGYAVGHVYSEIVITQKLERLYQKGSDLKERPFPRVMTDAEVRDWIKQVNSWSDETAGYLAENVNMFAHDRFLNTTGQITLNHVGLTTDENQYVNQIDWLQRNLEAIIVGRQR